MPEYIVTNPQTGERVRMIGNAPPTQQDIDAAFSAKQEIPKKREMSSALDKILMAIPGVPTLTELAASNNRTVIDMVDFVGPDLINGVLQTFGVEARVPTLEQGARSAGLYNDKGTFAGEGLSTDIASAVGSVLIPAAGTGMVMRQAAAGLPALATAGESVGRSVLRQAAATTPAQDVAYGAMAAAGGEIGAEAGGDAGRIVGSFLAPMTGGMLQGRLSNIINDSQQVNALARTLGNMSDDGAAKLLAEAMVRDGLSPDDVAARLAQLGPDAIPADLGTSFGRLLRQASNEIPRVQGRATNVLNQRQAGQAGRLASALDDGLGVPGLTLDDEIIRLNEVSRPVISGLYDQARSNPLPISGRLRTLFDGENSLGDAFRSAQRRVADKRAAGDVITHFDIIDATKQQLDDQIGAAIRAGERNTARDLVRLKNVMVDEADIALPGYREARDAFAGKMALESAAEQGTLFMRMSPREVADITKTMGESELRMYRLGAKQALLDKVDSIQVNADSIRRMFGRNGDSSKLRSLFPSETAFRQFNDSLEREAQFSMTRRVAQGNSQTAQQLADMSNPVATGRRIMGAAASGNPLGIADEMTNIINGLAQQRNSEAYRRSLTKAGDLLLNKGMNPDQVRQLLLSGDSGRLSQILQSAALRPAGAGTQALRGAASTQVGSDQ
jgi:hypothetical protein